MTNSKSTYPKEWIAQDSISMQSELAQQMNKACEIGTIGKYVVTMSLADLKEIANGELRNYSEELEHDNSALQYKLDKAIEALKFYAEQKHIITKNTDDVDEPNALWLEGFVEDGTAARKALEEIENDKQS